MIDALTPARRICSEQDCAIAYRRRSRDHRNSSSGACRRRHGDSSTYPIINFRTLGRHTLLCPRYIIFSFDTSTSTTIRSAAITTTRLPHVDRRHRGALQSSSTCDSITPYQWPFVSLTFDAKLAATKTCWACFIALLAAATTGSTTVF